MDALSNMMSNVHVNSLSHTTKLEITPELLSENWSISLPDAKRTLQATTQDSISIQRGNIHRRIKTLPHHSQYQHLTDYLGMFCSDTFKSNVKSLWGNMYCQLFCNRGNYRKTYPLKSKSEAHHALDSFIHDVGIPEEMLTDNAKELHLS